MLRSVVLVLAILAAWWLLRRQEPKTIWLPILDDRDSWRETEWASLYERAA